MILTILTLSGLAFSVVHQARGRGGSSEARMPKIKVNIMQPIDMKLCISHYIHKSIPHAKFEADSSSSFGDMTSQNFPRKKGTSYQIRIFTPLPRKEGLTFKKWISMSRIVLLDPKLTPMSISASFKQRKTFYFQNFWDISMRKEQQQSP